jgi:hypothetical protein
MRGFWLAALLVWMAGSICGRFSGAALPFWLVALFCGVTTILTAVDTIYGHSAGPGAMRPRAIFFAGVLSFAAVFGLEQQMPGIDRAWKVAPLPLAFVVLGIARGLLSLARRAGEQRAVLLAQVASFVACGASVWLMLVLLEVLP